MCDNEKKIAQLVSQLVEVAKHSNHWSRYFWEQVEIQALDITDPRPDKEHEDELDELRGEIKNLEEDNANLRDDVARLESDCDRLQTQLDECAATPQETEEDE